MHLDNDINNFQELLVCPSSINIEEVTQKTVNVCQLNKVFTGYYTCGITDLLFLHRILLECLFS